MKRAKDSWWHRILAVLAVLVVGVTLSGCGAATTTKHANDQIRVVATLGFYGEAAKAILGDRGQVTTVINSPSIDAESYEPDIKTAKLVAKADVVVENGLGYDSWMDRVVAANKAGDTKKLVIGDLMNEQTGDNPHLWTDPTTMTKVTRQLVTQFSKLEPQHAADFKRRGAAYERQLAVLPQMAQRLSKGSRHQQVAVSEPVFDLALKAMGYRVSDRHFAQSIEEDSDPTPADITQLQDQIKHRRIAFFVENTQNTSKNVTAMVNLAKQYHIPVVKVTETMPVHQTYRTWMLKQYQQVQRIQAKEGQS
ncbi:metal ABC transporter solute-binding protein, Zn/Mn family [Levilactobacillus tujiorum]|uniref:metal ABC transporter solute-binding protein, Zn/Mn family n=1 Tax=Levilactobacillus tujiorum TaxID=2912243 RepID=UPI001F103DB0|nr:zinc ABC transporter substrate-binding protein [Levilactobacillus tujiorum]